MLELSKKDCRRASHTCWCHAVSQCGATIKCAASAVQQHAQRSRLLTPDTMAYEGPITGLLQVRRMGSRNMLRDACIAGTVGGQQPL